MTVRVRGKNLEVTPALKDYVEKKVETITKQFKTVGEITAVMRIERNKHIVENYGSCKRHRSPRPGRQRKHVCFH